MKKAKGLSRLVIVIFYVITFTFKVSGINKPNQLKKDSLESELRRLEIQFPDGDSSLISTYIEIIDVYQSSLDSRLDSIAKPVEQLADKYKNNMLKVRLFQALGLYYNAKGRFEESLEVLRMGLSIVQFSSWPKDETINAADFLNSLGSLFASQGKEEKAVEYYKAAIEYAENNCPGYPKTMCSLPAVKSYHNLGFIYSKDLKDKNAINRAIEYKKTVIKFCQQLIEEYPKDSLKFKKGIYNASGAIANDYFNAGELEKSIEFYNETKKIAQELGAQYFPAVLVDLSRVYIEQKKLRQANEILSESIRIMEREQMRNDTYGSAHFLSAKINHSLGKFRQAEKNINVALEFYGEIFKYTMLIDIYKQKEVILLSLKKYEEAYEASQKWLYYKELTGKVNPLASDTLFLPNIKGDSVIMDTMNIENSKEYTASKKLQKNTMRPFFVIFGLLLILGVLISKIIMRS